MEATERCSRSAANFRRAFTSAEVRMESSQLLEVKKRCGCTGQVTQLVTLSIVRANRSPYS